MKFSCAVMVPLVLAGACSATSVGPGKEARAIAAPASWQGPLADRMNQDANGPATPALRSLVGQAPLAYVSRVPARATTDEPAYELAVFDDGTMVYEGHRCVKIGGIVLAHVGVDELTGIKDVLATLCTGLDNANDDELCSDVATLHVACSNGERMQSGSDHCRTRNEAQGQRVDALVTALGERLELASWLGEPTRRQACTPGAHDLSPHDLARTIRPDLADTGRWRR